MSIKLFLLFSDEAQELISRDEKEEFVSTEIGEGGQKAAALQRMVNSFLVKMEICRVSIIAAVWNTSE